MVDNLKGHPPISGSPTRAIRPQRVLSRAQLLDLIRGTDWAGYDRTVDGLVSRLRKKLVPEDGETQILRTVRGAGYIFTQSVT